MKEPIAKHEKVRFRRRDVSRLHAYPSATAPGLAAKPSLIPRWLRRGMLWIVLAIFGMAFAIAAVLAIIPSTGYESNWLRDQAESAVTRLAGRPVDTRIGKTTLALDRRYFLAIGIDKLAVADQSGGATVVDAGRLDLGIRFWPLLTGKVEIGSASLSDARLAIPASLQMPPRGDVAAILDDDGLVDPDNLLDAVFAGLESALAQIGPSGFDTIRLSNVEVVAQTASKPVSLMIVSARLKRSRGQKLDLEADIGILDHRVHITGSANGAVAGGQPVRFQLDAVSKATGKIYEMGGAEPDDHGAVRLGEIVLRVQGHAGDGSNPATISVSAGVGNSGVTIGTSSEVDAEASLQATLAHGAGALWLDRFDLSAGRSKLRFSGAVTPQPSSEGDENDAAYEFQLIGPEINLAPEDSPEPALAVLARLSGRIATDGRRIVANEINVSTGRGQVIGTGALEFVPGKSPGISLAIAIAQMSVSHAKNLWPFFAATGARRWALANVFGGTLENSRLLLRVEPGRLGDGIPLSRKEVSGHFEISRTRFDVAGTIPPMRDAIGKIDFGGTNVKIALTSGTVFMESGRSLKAGNGSLVIEDAHMKPLIGNVDIEIDGAAAAVTEVAGYEPINLSDYLPISPDGISGTAKGTIQARIPLEDHIARDELDWHLELAYEGLSLAEPYEGQRIEDATGTIVAGPEKADFVANAKLNGIRGKLSLSEPLGTDKSQRKRKATLFLENGDSDKLFDGLSLMVSGPLTLDVEQLGPGREKIHADLTKARLSLPWIGWSKKKGVTGRVDFVMNRSGKKTALSDFKLVGDGFGGTGKLTVDAGGLQSARFGNVALSPGDDFSMGIDRSGNSYSINVSGRMLDARSLLKRFASMGTSSDGDDDSGGDFSVKVDAEVSRAVGFNNVTLAGVKLAYSGSSSKVPGIRASASTTGGARATIVDASAGGSRKIEIKADDVGTYLRFLDIYDKIGGGRAALSLSGKAGGALTGQLEAYDFSLIDEARLASIVDRAPPGTKKSLNDAVKRDVDVSRARFDRGYAEVEMGKNYLKIDNAVVSGPLIGSTFAGTVFDNDGNMAINGTFLPAYGINRIFGEIPLLGELLGNGRGGGLIGITYRLSGAVKSPKIQINPLSIVAPGIFRSIFEFRDP